MFFKPICVDCELRLNRKNTLFTFVIWIGIWCSLTQSRPLCAHFPTRKSSNSQWKCGLFARTFSPSAVLLKVIFFCGIAVCQKFCFPNKKSLGKLILRRFVIFSPLFTFHSICISAAVVTTNSEVVIFPNLLPVAVDKDYTESPTKGRTIFVHFISWTKLAFRCSWLTVVIAAANFNKLFKKFAFMSTAVSWRNAFSNRAAELEQEAHDLDFVLAFFGFGFFIHLMTEKSGNGRIEKEINLIQVSGRILEL